MTTATEGAPRVTTPTHLPETTLDRLVATFVHYYPGRDEEAIAVAVNRDGIDVHQALVMLQVQHIVQQAAGLYTGTGRWNPEEGGPPMSEFDMPEAAS